MELSKPNSPVSKTLFTLAALVIIMAGIKTASSILIPFLLSIFIAIICNPLINKAEQYRVPKSIAVVLVIAIFVGIGLTIAGLLGNSLNELSALMPEYREQLTLKFAGVIDKLASVNIHISKDILMEYLDPAAAMGFAADMLSGFGGIMANLFFIILTVVFMLFEASSLPAKLHMAMKDPQMKMRKVDKFLASVNQYLAIKTMVSIATGCLVSLMLWMIGLDFFILWGVLAFLLNYIPNIGSIIAAVPAVLLALVQLDPTAALLIGAGYMIINTIMGNAVEPRYLGRGLGLSTLVVFLSLIFWGWLLGTAGMLLSVPLTMIIKIAFETSQDGKWISIMLSDEAEQEIKEIQTELK
ncbi:AI-2E family transporter [Thalassomonas sp. M1454]|uniref:AI-2E family transporter n=1 Tax=Thalassomonas sp. M1454 TaxID=2594477 RepID=UPI00117BF6BA|nr:AI-2E family transporter [Thalassomonas sp. M1454]TRX56605.1 AI-2E family transporter [Thalassomonas sp. M1454]